MAILAFGASIARKGVRKPVKGASMVVGGGQRGRFVGGKIATGHFLQKNIPRPVFGHQEHAENVAFATFLQKATPLNVIQFRRRIRGFWLYHKIFTTFINLMYAQFLGSTRPSIRNARRRAHHPTNGHEWGATRAFHSRRRQPNGSHRGISAPTQYNRQHRDASRAFDSAGE